MVETSILVPLVNQGFYASDGDIGTPYTNFTVKATLLLPTTSQNFITDNAVHAWVLDQVPSFAPQGGSELPSNGSNTWTNSIQYGGYLYLPNWSGTASGNIAWKTDPMPGS